MLPVYYCRKPKRASEISPADAEVSLHLPIISLYQVMNTEHFHMHTSNHCSTTPMHASRAHARTCAAVTQLLQKVCPVSNIFLSSLLIPPSPFSAWEVLVCRQEAHEGHPKTGMYAQLCELSFHVSALSVHVTCVTPVILLVTPICHCMYLSSHQCCPLKLCHRHCHCHCAPGDISSASKRVVVHGAQWEGCQGGRLRHWTAKEPPPLQECSREDRLDQREVTG